ncbi:DUF421 domain-containing protein [Luteibacter aegosomaticola]|uniref:DUF421 domain-containing protein n=1 Tax=Luteibacter aegosomaticola TaxID=2911538 RepID=UPI001FF94EED|nr:YetF domain-containing protein [Luteibacter aegosomaticola]UPG88248.1 DUF421 domain-containing protein [Luteibacter aegosomaticola]
MNDVLNLSSAWWTFVVRGAVTYLGLLTLMRLAGKRSFGELSAFDVVVIALAGGTLRTAIIGEDQGMLGPFLGVAGILATDKAIAWLSTRVPWFNRLVEGFPSLLVRDGRRDPTVMRRQSLTDAALDRALHAAGLEDEQDVVAGRLEPNGKITLVRRSR